MLNRIRKNITLTLVAVVVCATTFGIPHTTARARELDTTIYETNSIVQTSNLVTQDLTILTPEQIVDELVNTVSGLISFSNVSYNGSTSAAGTFDTTNGENIIGFSDGIVLSTGNVADVVGPNVQDGISTDYGLAGDQDLAGLIPGYDIYDATVLEFDFVPKTSVITFEYVFTSEEYNEYVGSQFNDVFGFFVNGVNQALIPGTYTPVSINNINIGNQELSADPTNPEFYRNNDLSDGGGSINTEMDGLTVTMRVLALVIPNQTNHIKMAIGDAGDGYLDSNVFIKKLSFDAVNPTLTPLTHASPVGSEHFLTTTLVDGTGNPIQEYPMVFKVLDGPNAGVTGSAVTDEYGNAYWSYISIQEGEDIIISYSSINPSIESNEVYKIWEAEGNLVPIARNDSFSLLEGAYVEGNVKDDNNFGIDFEADIPSQISLVTDVNHGVLDLYSDGYFIYTPDNDYYGIDGFTYQLRDNDGDTDTANVSFNIVGINDAPVAQDDYYTITEGGTLNEPLGILFNDYDSENSTLTAMLNSDVSYGTLTLNNDGTFVYIHDSSETLYDHFTYKANDGVLDSNIATVEIMITPENDPPVTVVDYYTIGEGGTLNIPAPGVLDNDSDPENDYIEAVLVNDVSNGSLLLQVDGSFSYTHNDSETTADSFTYVASDGSSESELTDVTIDILPVNDAPMVGDIPDQTIEEAELFTTINLDDYVEDIDNPDYEITWSVNGYVELLVTINNRIATITAPYPAWNGSELLTFTATDTGGSFDSDSAVFTVNEVFNEPNVHDIPDQTINEGELFTTIILDNYVDDTDNPDNELSWYATGNSELTVDIVDRIAAVSIPYPDWYGSESITFTASDPDQMSDNDTAVFTVNPINDAPEVSDILDQTIDEGQDFVSIILDDYVSDIDNDNSEISWSCTGNSYLSVSIAGRIATISAPNPDWYGSETVTFIATDPGELSDNDTATFSITSLNDPPVVSDIPDQTIDEGNTFTAISLDNFVDDVDNIDSDISWEYSGNSELSVSITDRIATISIPYADWNGSETVIFTATDPDQLSDNDTAVFTVNPVNDAPVVSDIPDQTVNEGELFTDIILDDYVDDVDTDDSDIIWTYSGNTVLNITIIDRIAIISVPDPNWNGSETIFFTASDSSDAIPSDSDASSPEFNTEYLDTSLPNTDSATFSVTAVNDAPVVSDIPDQTVDEGNTFTTISLDDFVNDVDNTDQEI
ncbi:MAG: choice-of-anchor L domain-containing protein, partial [Dehalococcoidales bacterium]|nr:choice-of-anchor L domain-containing protein [Dehalococcoidales bacterium]